MGHLANLLADGNILDKGQQRAIDHNRGEAQADSLDAVFKAAAVVQMDAHWDGRMVGLVDHRLDKGVLDEGQLIRVNGNDDRCVLSNGFLDDTGQDHVAGCIKGGHRKVVGLGYIQNGFHVYEHMGTPPAFVL